MAVDRTSLRTFLQTELGVDLAGVEDDTPLFSTGLIDSFALVSLLTFLEESAGVRADPADVNLENLDTIARILAYVARTKR